jgi:hypothetical protein
MARDEVAAEPVSDGFDDDEVDLSFAGPEPVAAAPWPLRLLDVVSAYLPLLLMAALAAGTWWLVGNVPPTDAPRAAAAPRHEADYVMTRFIVQRFASDGSLRTQIEGDRLRHFLASLLATGAGCGTAVSPNPARNRPLPWFRA